MSQKIIEQMKKNSAAWHTASASEKKRLEAENQRLGSQVGGSYNSSSGTWSNQSGGSLYGNSSSKSSSSGSKQSGGSSSSYNAYNVTTQAGIDRANSMGAGETWYNPADGSVWNKGSGGAITVMTKAGNWYPLTINGQSFGTKYVAPEENPYTQWANDEYLRYFDEQRGMLDEARAADEAALRRQTQSTIDSINANIPKINQDYEAQQRAAYIQNAKAQTGMGDYLAAKGYSGGMTESTALGLQSSYENLRNTNDQQKNNALMELQNMVAQAQATGDVNLANLASQYYQQVASAMQSARQQADAMAQWQSDVDFRERQFADSQAQWQSDDAFRNKKFSYQQDRDVITDRLAQARLNRSGGGSGGGSANDAYLYMLEGDVMANPQSQSLTQGNTLGDFSNSLMQRGLSGTSSVAVNNIIAAYQRGEISREEANRRLAPLGAQI